MPIIKFWIPFIIHDENYKIYEINAYSLVEAKLILIYHIWHDLDDATLGIICDNEEIIKKYYGIKQQHVKYFMIYNLLILPWKDSIITIKKIQKYYSVFNDNIENIESYINLNIPSFAHMFKSRNPKFIIKCIMRNYIKFNKNVKETPWWLMGSLYANEYIHHNTFISNMRVLNKIRNNNYWHIWRLLF